MKTITAYKCGFCTKKYENLKVALWHERYCHYNPENWHICLNCKYMEVSREEGKKYFYCIKLDKDFHTYVAERRRYEVAKTTPLMPKECNEFVKQTDEELF